MKLLSLRNRMLWPSLSFMFDGVEGSLGAGAVGDVGTDVGWTLIAI